ncbi:Uncharacterised protein [BD1-7 clade bacterium]|uniref:2-hydroxyglutaryl-CoA dehydratase n=1 Tax=BD1-7 clade bacterium TaxID=2029982 RepID=A0A5S9QNX3_9GAMM|nr:Uncharacterised protein [BD1-7 clade bacterium]CAA0121715.1 Uncharacterised protein [BD1-7 clade bacterium]
MDNIIARTGNTSDTNAPVTGSWQPGRTGNHYVESVNQTFTEDDVRHTTILVAGLTVAQDRFLAAALKGLGYRVRVLDVPNYDALAVGKEFGNRGQCNPTYFTVGNLVKYLTQLRDETGLSVDEIRSKYVFLTAGACGPCRFGTYVTEYRKALRDSGFDGFRVLSASQTGGANQVVGEGGGFKVSPRFFIKVVQAFVLGDVLNGLMYRIRPYEVNEGETNKAVEQCRQIIETALAENRSLLRAAHKVRGIMGAIEVNKTRVKPKVSIIGEFWAMTTEGDGNYKLQQFLEQEGAEVDVQFITAWMLYLIWQARFDTRNRDRLTQSDNSRRGLKGISVPVRMAKLWLAEKVLMTGFQTFASLMGFKDYHFSDQAELATLSHDFYNNDNRGGEGHMEVGKLISNVANHKANMTISVKPFGCMPSSGVSDGVQSKITQLWPDAIFLPIETTGDGAVNVYSRIQMQLFKARQAAEKEVEVALESRKAPLERLKSLSQHWKNPLSPPKHKVCCTAANTIYGL